MQNNETSIREIRKIIDQWATALYSKNLETIPIPTQEV
jgi:hypothetical protein